MYKNLDSFKVFRARYPAFFFPAFLVNKSLFSKRFKRKFGMNPTFGGTFLRDNKRIFFLGTEDDTNKLKERLMDVIKNNPKFVNEIFLNFKNNKRKLFKFVRSNLKAKILRKKSNKKLLRFLKKYYKIYYKLNLFLAVFIYFGAEAIQKELKKILSKKHFFLLKSQYKTYVARYEEDYYLKCKDISKKLSNKWGWIPFDYVGPEVWDENYFQEKLGIKKSIEKRILEHSELVSLQNKTMKEYDTFTKRLIRDFHLISHLQDERKAVVTLSHTYLQEHLLKEISLRTGIAIKHLRVMLLDEISSALLKKKSFGKSKLELRLNNSLLLCYKDEISLHVDDALVNQFRNKLNISSELKGIVASKGVAKGKVKVCLTSDDLHKVKKGDILVAPMTTPNYFSAMDKAAGFITDEGGITCHAAVIAREMKKPCIIGTKSATDILKDGDVVVLDADKGEIKKI